jgi:hypothetical protein
VVLDLVDGDLPAEHAVTLRAIGAELPQVDVRVAISTILPDIGENWLRMTFNTSNFFVLSTQRIRGLVVVKLQYRAYRTPSRRGVTVFAWNRQGSVRTADITLLSADCRNEQKQPNNEGSSCDEMCVLKRNTPLAPRRPSRVESRLRPVSHSLHSATTVPRDSFVTVRLLLPVLVNRLGNGNRLDQQNS